MPTQTRSKAGQKTSNSEKHEHEKRQSTTKSDSLISEAKRGSRDSSLAGNSPQQDVQNPRKRSSEAGIEVVEERPAKRNRQLQIHSISVPLNDGRAYEEARDRRDFYAFCPLDHTNMKKAVRDSHLNLVVVGMCWNTVVEGLVMDKETDGDEPKLPWQVPKVLLEYKRIDYVSEDQAYSKHSIEVSGQPVSPTSLPDVQQMSSEEYEEAVQNADARIAVDDRETYDFCQEVEAGWLSYNDR